LFLVWQSSKRQEDSRPTEVWQNSDTRVPVIELFFGRFLDYRFWWP